MTVQELYSFARGADWEAAVRLVTANTRLDYNHARGFVVDCKHGFITAKRLSLIPMK